MPTRNEMPEALLRRIRKQGGRTVTCEAAYLNAASMTLLVRFSFAAVKKASCKKRGEETYFGAHIYALQHPDEDGQSSGVPECAPDVLP